MVYAIDFDGTLCVNDYPNIGDPLYDIISFLKQRRIEGDKLILWTCRSGPYLEAAIAWCANLGLEFDAVNDNLEENITFYGNNCRKVCADFYIDDRNLYIHDTLNTLLQTG